MKHLKQLFIVFIITILALTSCARQPIDGDAFSTVLDADYFIVKEAELTETEISLGITKYYRAATADDQCRLQFIVLETIDQAKSVYASNFKNDIYTTGKDYATVQDDISRTDFDYIHATVEDGFLLTARVGNTILAASSSNTYSDYIFLVFEELGYNK